MLGDLNDSLIMSGIEPHFLLSNFYLLQKRSILENRDTIFFTFFWLMYRFCITNLDLKHLQKREKWLKNLRVSHRESVLCLG